MPDVTSGPGDCFNRIANSNGFFNYRSVYDHDDNAAKFPNPNQIAEGSTVKVPEKAMKAFDLVLDGEKKFRIVRKKTKLSIKLCRADTKVEPNISKAALVVRSQKVSSKSGTLEIDDLDPNTIRGFLKVSLEKPPKYADPPPTDVGAADQHPPPIRAADFEDPKPYWPKKGEIFVWDLQIGSLEPHTVTRGVLQRLENLGFRCSVGTVEDGSTRRAVKTYRRAVENKVAPQDTEAVADIQDHIRARHDA